LTAAAAAPRARCDPALAAQGVAKMKSVSSVVVSLSLDISAFPSM
jgi:hypothetical protein